jgi:hypothetical protein
MIFDLLVLNNHQIDRVGLPDMAGNTVLSSYLSLSLFLYISVNFCDGNSLLFAGLYTTLTANTFPCIYRN